MNLPFDEIGDAAKALRDAHFDGFSIVPYNQFAAARSQVWRILPEQVNPAFHLGKIELAADEADADSVFAGFSVEKGLGENCGEKKSEIIQPHWFWHDFLDHCNVPLAEAVEQANEAVGGDMRIYVGSGIPKMKPTDARVVFNVRDQLRQGSRVDGVR